jgi:hypothetical protein
MMKKIIFLIIIATLSFVFISSISAKEPFDKLSYLLEKDFLTSAEIIENADILDGYLITLRGEVISEPLERKDFCWINVYDNENYISIGVMTTIEMISEIEFWGSHRTTGDTVDIEGTVFRADPSADGELDMHAENISIVHDIPAGPRNIDIPFWKLLLAIILTLLMLIIFFEKAYHFIKAKVETKNTHILEDYIEN